MNTFVLLLMILNIISKNVETIENGIKARTHEFKYMASLWYFDEYICSASVISERHILTAAHCVYGRQENNLKIIAGIKKIGCFLSYGEQINCLLKVKKMLAIQRNIQEVYIEPNFKSNDRLSSERGQLTYAKNDIAVLHLSKRLSLGMKIGKVSLPDRDLVSECEICTCSGWGKTDVDGENIPSPDLYYIFVIRLEPGNCMVSHRDNEFCASEICQQSILTPGDSGSPMVCNGTIIGIMGAASAMCPAIFHNVYTSISFIHRILNDTRENRIISTS